jgi:hypothetical protein
MSRTRDDVGLHRQHTRRRVSVRGGAGRRVARSQWPERPGCPCLPPAPLRLARRPPTDFFPSYGSRAWSTGRGPRDRRPAGAIAFVRDSGADARRRQLRGRACASAPKARAAGSRALPLRRTGRTHPGTLRLAVVPRVPRRSRASVQDHRRISSSVEGGWRAAARGVMTPPASSAPSRERAFFARSFSHPQAGSRPVGFVNSIFLPMEICSAG